MILKNIETVEIRNWRKFDCDNGIELELIIDTHWFRYRLNEREEELFKQGLNPKEMLRICEYDTDPVVIVTKWDIYA